MSTSLPVPQPSILASAGAPAGYSLELDVAGDARAALRRLAADLPPNATLGVGAPLALGLGVTVPGLRAYATLAAQATLPAAQHALWIFLTAPSTGEALEGARAIVATAGADLRVVEETPLFRYRDGRDLTDYLDGTANPTVEYARTEAFVASGPLVGASFAFVQRFVHDLAAFQRLPVVERDHVMGRSHADNHELAEAPITAHVKRTAQETFSPTSFMVRRSMPWGGLGRHGLQFIAFGADLDRFDRVLRRMVGAEDGRSDALLRYTRAETGGYYLCPPVRDGKIDLSALGL